MKNVHYRFFKQLIIIQAFILFLSGLSYGEETPFIPKNFGLKAVVPYDDVDTVSSTAAAKPGQGLLYSLSTFHATDRGMLSEELFQRDTSNGSILTRSFYLDSDFGISIKKGVFLEERGYETSSVYIRTAARYLSASGDAMTGSFMGGIAAGFYTGLDRFMDTGAIDVASSARSAALMAGSSYVGLSAGAFTANNIMNPIFGSSLGGGFMNAFSSVAGGTAAGFLYASGAYAFGAVDRHTARLMIAKTAFGSAASAGITAIIGTSTATTGLFAVGPYVMPLVAALGAGYLVEKFFEFVDKQEERERIENLIEVIR